MTHHNISLKEPKISPFYCAESLTGQDGQARIVLNDELYTLRITRAGKLVLIKGSNQSSGMQVPQ